MHGDVQANRHVPARPETAGRGAEPGGADRASRWRSRSLAVAGLAGLLLPLAWWGTYAAAGVEHRRLVSALHPFPSLPVLLADDLLFRAGTSPVLVVLHYGLGGLLLTVVAAGLWWAVGRGRAALAALVLLLAAALAIILVGAFPYDPRAYAASPAQWAASVAFVCSLVAGTFATGVALVAAGRRAAGAAALALDACLALAAVGASGYDAVELPGSTALPAGLELVQAAATIGYLAAGAWLLDLSRPRRRAVPAVAGRPPRRARRSLVLSGAVLVATALAYLAFLAGATGVALGAIAWSQLEGRTQVGAMQFGMVVRHYRVYVPASVVSGPGLVIVLHGADGSGLQAEAMSRFDRQADRLGWVAAYPDGVLDGWDAFACCPHAGADDVAFVSGLVGRLETVDGVDPGRVFVAGLSRGGMMSYRLACELSSRVAAIAAVSGNMATLAGSAQDVPCRPQRAVSVLAIHGTADPRVPIDGGRTDISYAPLSAVVGVWRSLDGCGRQPAIQASGPSTITTWSCRDGSAVVTRVVTGGGHAWPGARWPFADPPADASFDASAVIADFFAAHARG